MSEFFNLFSTEIIFLHVISAVIWLGGMIVVRYAIHFSMMNIENPRIKLERILENLHRFFQMVIPAICILLLTAIIMIIALGFKGTSLYSMIISKEIIWFIMTGIFVFIYVKRNKAQKAYELGDMISTKNHLAIIAKYLIPINIVLGLVALYLGVILRGL